MGKIKVLRIVARLNIGGPAINAILLTAGLDRNVYESVLITGKPGKREGEMTDLLEEKQIRPIVIPQLKREINLWSDIAAFLKICSLIRKEKPAIVHTHTAKAGALGRVAGLLYGCKLVHTFHGHVLEGYFDRIKSGIFIWIERLLALFTHKIIVVSPSIKEGLLKLKIAPENKIAVIPLGLELDSLLVLDSPNAAKASFNIGIVGRLAPIKNHRMFLEAAKIIKDYPLKFFIIGDGELRESLIKYAKELGLQDKVVFSGWQKDLIKVYEQLDLVVLSSLNEGTPVSIIEAMAAGRPVIATDVGGVGDLIGDNERGILIKSGDAALLAEGMVKLINNPGLRIELGKRAREFVRDRYAKERLIKGIESLYNQLSKKGPSLCAH